MKALIITLIVIVGILITPYLIPKKPLKTLPDDTLRKEALGSNLRPIPNSRVEMLKELNSSYNPMSSQKILLGKKLYFDPILSKDYSVSCATCHILSEGGDDNLPVAIGYHGRVNPHHLNSPTVLNSALQKFEFWDGRVKTVEEQAGGPIQAPFEMNLTPKEAIERLNSNIEYKRAFTEVFGENGITFENIRMAIGAYERTLLTRGAFDKFLEGNNSAISPQAKRGLTIFIRRGCKSCHSGMSVGGQFIKRFPLRRYLDDYLGFELYPKFKKKMSEFPFDNIGDFHGRDGQDYFKVPVLRNIARTAPYFHNGSVKDLHEAVRIMSKYQIGDEFNKRDIDDVVAFLKTLNGEIVNYGY